MLLISAVLHRRFPVFYSVTWKMYLLFVFSVEIFLFSTVLCMQLSAPRLGAEQDQLPCVSTGTSSSNCQQTRLLWFGHVTRHDSLKTILQDTLKSGQGNGRQRKGWIDSFKEWTSLPMSELPTMVSGRKDWKRISADSSFLSLRRPIRSRD